MYKNRLSSFALMTLTQASIYTDSDYPFGISGDVVYKERWRPWHKPWFTDSDLQTFLTDLSYGFIRKNLTYILQLKSVIEM
jgi:hypothetical protein